MHNRRMWCTQQNAVMRNVCVFCCTEYVRLPENRDQHLDGFMTWLHENDVDTSNVQIHKFPDQGYGLQAKREMNVSIAVLAHTVMCLWCVAACVYFSRVMYLWEYPACCDYVYITGRWCGFIRRVMWLYQTCYVVTSDVSCGYVRLTWLYLMCHVVISDRSCGYAYITGRCRGYVRGMMWLYITGGWCMCGRSPVCHAEHVPYRGVLAGCPRPEWPHPRQHAPHHPRPAPAVWDAQWQLFLAAVHQYPRQPCLCIRVLCRSILSQSLLELAGRTINLWLNKKIIQGRL